MENFVLYEEIGKGENTTVYKGRRKGTINFVAIHCIDKCRRPQITNLVRLTHEVTNENIVKFYEWYETSNHLWLVVELCTGGSLDTIIKQDDHLPESSIRKFGIDLIKGLHHIHSLGIVFSDIKPSKILLDGPGILKYAGFGMGRLEGENLEELFEQFSDTGETWTSTEEKPERLALKGLPINFKTKGSVMYLAPEIFDGGAHTYMTDLWALGCVFYEMYTGHPPFLAENFTALVEKVMHKDLPAPKVKGSRVSAKPSPHFYSMLQGLFEKHPEKRLSWENLLCHPFWEGGLKELGGDLDTQSEELLSIRQSLRQSVNTLRASTSVLPKGNSVLGHIQDVSVPPTHRQSFDGENAALDTDHVDGTEDHHDRPDTAMSEFRPKTAPGNGDSSVNFTLSSRPMTAGTPVPGEYLTNRQMTQSPLNVKDTLRRAKNDGADLKINQLIYHQTDFTVSPIVDNPKIQKPAAMKYESKILPVPPHTVERLQSFNDAEVQKQCRTLTDVLALQEKGPPSQKRIHVLNYTGTITRIPSVANHLIQCTCLNVLAKHARDAQTLELRAKLCRVIGLIAHNATEIAESVALSEVVVLLTELLRDNFRNAKIKAVVLPALGEVLYLIASQEDILGHPVEAWNVTSITYTLMIRCLREGEDPAINHYAAKSVENITVTQGVHAQKFSVPEVGQMLWYLFSHATADALRITAVSALARMTRHSISVFQTAIEKVSLPKMLATMSMPISRIQQAVITMFAALITSEVRLNRVIQDKDFIQNVVRLLESPSMVIRGKAFLVLLEAIKNNQEVLLTCCQQRLVMYIERDSRKNTANRSDNCMNMEYLTQCLEWFLAALVEIIPSITRDISTTLDAVSGRKHPSTIQVKQLKAVLPMMPVIYHFITSPVLRPRIIDKSFIKNLSGLLNHVKSIDTGSTQIQSATGPTGTDDFIQTVFIIVEALVQHPQLIVQHHDIVIDNMLPALAHLVQSSGGEVRALALRLFSEMVSLFLNHQQYDPQIQKSNTRKVHKLTADTIMPQYEQLLLEQDPIPSYALKLLLALLEQNPLFIKQFEGEGLTQVLFQVLMDHQANPISSTMQQIVCVLNCLVSHKDSKIHEMYEHGLVDHLSRLFMEVCKLCMQNDNPTSDIKSIIAMLQSLLDTLHGTLKYVSDVVRKALQSKKGTSSAHTNRESEQAEQLLLTTKPFTELTGLLTQLLIYDDTDICDVALKCLSLLVQLFGGEYTEAMSPENMACYSAALTQGDIKKQKVLLRIIKRLISTERSHSDQMRQHGSSLGEAIKSLVHTASSHADVGLSSLAAEILKVTGHLS